MNNRIITAAAWACALAVLFYRRALVPLALLALDALTSSQAGPCDSIPPECWVGHDLPDRLSPPEPTLGEGLTNAEIKAILGIKGNRTRAQLIERLRQKFTDDYEDSLVRLAFPQPIHRYMSPCITPATPKTSRSSTADSWTSSARAKTKTAATTSLASSARSKP